MRNGSAGACPPTFVAFSHLPTNISVTSNSPSTASTRGVGNNRIRFDRAVNYFAIQSICTPGCVSTDIDARDETPAAPNGRNTSDSSWADCTIRCKAEDSLAGHPRARVVPEAPVAPPHPTIERILPQQSPQERRREVIRVLRLQHESLVAEQPDEIVPSRPIQRVESGDGPRSNGVLPLSQLPQWMRRV